MKKMSLVIFEGNRIIANLLAITMVLLFAGGAQASALDCTQCHGNGTAIAPGTDAHPVDTPFGSADTYRNITTGAVKGNHNTHFSATTNGVICAKCHAAGAATYLSNHASTNNFNIQMNATVKYNKGAGVVTSFPQTLTPTLGTCTTVNCHFESVNNAGNTPVWGAASFTSQKTVSNADASNTCNQCHSGAGLASGKHTIHISKYAAGDNLTACVKCHPDNYIKTGAAAFTHATSSSTSIAVTFAAAPNNGTGTPAGLRAAPTFLNSAATPSSATCSTLYCHSTGQSATGGALTAPNYTTPAWNGAALNCGGCHKNMLSDVAATGNHVKHAQTLTILCATCHNGYTSTTTNAATHADGSINLSFTGNGSTTVYSQGNTHAPANGFGKCSTTYCHSAGQSSTGGALVAANYSSATWGGATRNCGGCHKNMLSDVAATGNHVKHAQTLTIACATCHNGYTSTTTNAATHADGSINLSFTGNGSTTVYSQGNTHAPANGFGKCSTTYCHSAGQSSTGGALVAANYSSATWGGAARNCGGCHKNMLSDVAATGNHVKHAQTAAIACATCHNGYTSTTTNAATHADGSINLSFSGNGSTTVYSQGNTHASAGGFGKCSTTYCHSAGQSSTGGALVAANYSSATWGGVARNCGGCHKNMKTDATAPGSHVGHAQTGVIACATCHNGYTETTTGASHVDNQINLSFTATAGVGTIYSKGNTHAPASGYGTCSTSLCHGASSPTWGNNSTNATCTKCHGKPTALANYSSTNAWQAAPGYAQVAGSGTYTDGVSNTAPYGAHDAHVRSANNYTALNITCDNCHGALPGSGSHANGSVAISFSNLAKNIGTSGGSATTGPSTRGTLASAYTAGTCSAVYCHGGVMAGTDTTPEWIFSTVSYLTPYAKTVANCGKCHAALPVVTAKDHSAMVFASTACTSCHGHEGTGTKHIDGILQASGACNSCHGYQAGSWAAATVINAEGMGAHEKHITYLTTKRFTVTLNPLVDGYGADTASMGGTWTNVCGVCHSGGTHQAGGVEVFKVNNAAYFFGSAGATTYQGVPGTSSGLTPKTCSNISCHYFTTPLWSTY